MKTKACFAVLLGAISLCAAPVAVVAADAPALAPDPAPALALMSCGGPVVPLLAPAPAASAKPMPLLMLPTCGACSTTICVGARIGQACGFVGHLQAFCGDSGSTCSQDGKTQCICSTGPPF